MIVNFSNDEISTNITSSLKMTNTHVQVIGNYKNELNELCSSAPAAKYLNEVMTQKNSPVHYLDCYLNLASNMGIRIKENSLIKKTTEQNQEYFFSINNLRKGLSKNVVGIQLKSSSAGKDVPFKVLAQYIQLLLKNNVANPVLLIAPELEEINYAKDICNYIGVEIATLTTNFTQLGSVLLNLDLLLTPDTSVKHLADLHEVPMIEYLADTEQLKQASITENNSIIINTSSDLASLSTDVFILTQKILYPETNKTHVYSNLVLTVRNTNFGIFYTQDLASKNVTNICEKAFINKILYNRLFLKNISTIKESIKNIKFSTKILAQETHKLRNDATQISRLLLNCLRSLLNRANDRATRREFLLALSELLTVADTESYLRPLILNLKADLENLKPQNPIQNKKTLESLFFEMKKQVALIGETINEFETCTQAGASHRFMEI
jgi:hypothetical protein